MNGSAVSTTEGIGGERQKCGLHPVQKRTSDLHGTQCGFCKPGFVMSIYSGLKMQSGREEVATAKEMESLIDGNLCRCTGYRPILDTAKSFGGDANADDICGPMGKTDVGPVDVSKKKI